MKTELEGRTRRFSASLIQLLAHFPRGVVGQVLGTQLLRAGTAIGANYREGNRAESRKDFVHKISLAVKEASETGYWLEICLDAEVGPHEQLTELYDEASQLLAILVTIGRKATRSMNTSTARQRP